MEILGVDIGGSGIKGAVVEVGRGQLVTDRHRLLTPQPAKPTHVAEVVAQIADYFDWKGPIGCTFPAIIRNGTVFSAAHVDETWVGLNGQELLQRKIGHPVILLNDADAAGIAEMEFGAGRGQMGLVIMLTFGTGIGCGMFFDGQLVPNAELGHIEIRGKDAEERATDRVRQEKGWSWEKWGRHLEEYLGRLEFLLSPDLFIIGGGVSREFERYAPQLHTQTRVVQAQFLNEAGIVGAALAARSLAAASPQTQ